VFIILTFETFPFPVTNYQISRSYGPAFGKKNQFPKADMKKLVVEGGGGCFLKTPPDFSALSQFRTNKALK